MSRALHIVSTGQLCAGNAATEFQAVVDMNNGRAFKDRAGTNIVIIKAHYPHACFSYHHVNCCYFITGEQVAYQDSLSLQQPIIRSSSCEFILPSGSKSKRCTACSSFRSNLRIRQKRLMSRSSEIRVSVSSRAPYSSLSQEEMKKRMANLQQELSRIRKQNMRLKAKVAEESESIGVTVDSDMHQDLEKIMEEEEKKPACHQNSFQRLFWEQQLNAARQRNANSMRWHPLMIRWCLYLRHQSQSAYETLRSTGCISLPSQRTLRDYTHYIPATTGFSIDVDEQLMDAGKILTCEDYEKCVILLLDEMHIRENLVFDKTTGALVGLVNIGDTNSHLLEYERSLQQFSTPRRPELAKTMMVFMVRGLFTSLRFAYAQFPCKNVTADLLFDPFWEAVYRLERCGLNPTIMHN